MGILEQDVGYRRGDGETQLKGDGKAVTVISLAQAEAALEAAAAADAPVVLMSAPDAAASVGAGWFDAVVTLSRESHPLAKSVAVLDCGGAPGDAMAALRHGVEAIRYEGASQTQIEDIARKCGANVIRRRPRSLDLNAVETAGGDLIAACRAWLED